MHAGALTVLLLGAMQAPAQPASKPDVIPNAPAPKGMEGLGRTPEEQQRLDDLQRMLETYETESKDFRRDVQLMVEKK